MYSSRQGRYAQIAYRPLQVPRGQYSAIFCNMDRMVNASDERYNYGQPRLSV